MRRFESTNSRLSPAARRRLRVGQLQLELLESRHLLAAITFVPEPPIATSDHAGARDVTMADLDGDHDLDLLAGSAFDGRVGWYENLDGQGTFGRLRLITERAPGVALVIAADLDDDDDLDVAFVSPADNRVAWHENLDGFGNFGPERVVTDLAIAGESIHAADLDGDDDLDLVSTSADPYDSDVSWYENVDGQGNFGPQQVITVEVQFPYAAVAADLDGDGDADVVSASYVDDRIAWYENLDGEGTFGPQRRLGDLYGAGEVAAADIDGDGDIDLVAGSFYEPGEIVWYQNLDAEGTFSDPVVVDRGLRRVETIQVIDLDGDDDLDLVTESIYDEVAIWYENLDGLGDFGAAQIIAGELGTVPSVYAGDLDGDGNVDVAFASLEFDEIGWTKQEAGGFGPITLVSRAGAVGVDSVVALDVDGDGDLDVASASVLDNTVAWYENLDREGAFGEMQIVDDLLEYAINLEAPDLNGDNRPDLLVVGQAGTLAWYENLGGPLGFGPRQTLANDLFGSEETQAADLDGDGDLDVIATVTDPSAPQVVWFENLDRAGNFGAARTIASLLDSPREVAVADLDGDDDLDLAVVSLYDSRVVWFENQDSKGNFAAEKLITATTETPIAISAGDIDLDGDPDLLVAPLFGDELYWLENVDAADSFAGPWSLGPVPLGPEAIDLADLDGDGDLDALVASVVDDTFAWYENLDHGQFAPFATIDKGPFGPSSIRAADLNGDGNLDVLTGAYDVSRVLWYRHVPVADGDFNQDGTITAEDIDLLCQQIRGAEPEPGFDLNDDGLVDMLDFERLVLSLIGTTPGDANLDGIFDSGDLVEVFALGQYEDEVSGNSGWADGDWNCDSEFDSEDLVAAFQQGGYVAAARPASIVSSPMSPSWLSDVAASLAGASLADASLADASLADASLADTERRVSR